MVNIEINDSNQSLFTFTDNSVLNSTETDFRTPMYAGKFQSVAYADVKVDNALTYETPNEITISAILNTIRFNTEWLYGTNVNDKKPALRYKTLGFQVKVGANYFFYVHMRVLGVYSVSNKSFKYRYILFIKRSTSNINTVATSFQVPQDHNSDYALSSPLWDVVYSTDTPTTATITDDSPFEFGITLKPDGKVEPYGRYKDSPVSYTVRQETSKLAWNELNLNVELISLFTRGTVEPGTFPEFYNPPNLASANYLSIDRVNITSISSDGIVDLSSYTIFEEQANQMIGAQGSIELSISDPNLANYNTHKLNIGKTYQSMMGVNVLTRGEIREVEPINQHAVKYIIYSESAKLDTRLVNDDPIRLTAQIEGVYDSNGKSIIKSFNSPFVSDDSNRILLVEKNNKKQTVVMPKGDYSVRREIYEDDLYSQSTPAIGDEAPDGLKGSASNLFENNYREYDYTSNALGLANLDKSLFNQINFGFILDFPVVYDQNSSIESIILEAVTSHFDFAYYDTPLSFGLAVGHPEILILYKAPIIEDEVITGYEDRWFKLHQITNADSVGAISNNNIKKKTQRYNDSYTDAWGDVLEYPDGVDTDNPLRIPLFAKESLDTAISLDITKLIQQLDKSVEDRKGISLGDLLYTDDSYDGTSGLENKQYIRIAIRSGDSYIRNKLNIWKAVTTISYAEDQGGDFNTFDISYDDINQLTIEPQETTTLTGNAIGIGDIMYIIPTLSDYLANLTSTLYPIEFLDVMPKIYANNIDYTNLAYTDLFAEISEFTNFIWYIDYNNQKVLFKKPRIVSDYNSIVNASHCYEKPAVITYDGSSMRSRIRVIGNNLTYNINVSNVPELINKNDYFITNLNTESEALVKEKALQTAVINKTPIETFEFNIHKDSDLIHLKVGDFLFIEYIFRDMNYSPTIPYLVYSISKSLTGGNESYNILLQKRVYNQ